MLGSIIIWLVVGAIAGFLAGQIFKGKGFGLVGNIIVGLIGSAVGGFLLNLLNIGFSIGGPFITDVVVALLGALVLLFLVNLVFRK